MMTDLVTNRCNRYGHIEEDNYEIFKGDDLGFCSGKLMDRCYGGYLGYGATLDNDRCVNTFERC